MIVRYKIVLFMMVLTIDPLTLPDQPLGFRPHFSGGGPLHCSSLKPPSPLFSGILHAWFQS